jgi:hypothetical protein
MSDETGAPDIPRALTDAQWFDSRYWFTNGDVEFLIRGEGAYHSLRIQSKKAGVQYSTGDVNDLAALIALANAAMNDDDPRKIRPSWITALRHAADALTNVSFDSTVELHEIADALESLLPPDRP